MKRILFSAALVAVCLAALAGVTPAMAQSGNSWRIDFYNNPDWTGYPVTTLYNSYIAYDWGYGSPSPAVPVDNFSGRMTTDAFFYAGTYQFSLVADDEIVLIVDGMTRLDTRGLGQSGKTFTLNIPMWQGMHHVEVLYREYSLAAYTFVNWAYVDGNMPPPPPPPSNYPPLPPSSDNVQTKFGDYTPCIQQGIHQANCFVSDGAWDSPNLGSIRIEAQIVSWSICAADTQNMFLNDRAEPKSYNCSKTMAGWFPN